MSDQEVIDYFSQYGQIGSSKIIMPDISSIEKLSEQKKEYVLNHKFAFICYKECADAMMAASKVPFYKINDTDYNQQIDKLVQLITSLGENIEPKSTSNKGTSTS